MGEPYWPDDATPEEIRRITKMVDGFMKVRPVPKVSTTTATPSAPKTSKASPKKSRPKR